MQPDIDFLDDPSTPYNTPITSFTNHSPLTRYSRSLGSLLVRYTDFHTASSDSWLKHVCPYCCRRCLASFVDIGIRMGWRLGGSVGRRYYNLNQSSYNYPTITTTPSSFNGPNFQIFQARRRYLLGA